MLYTSRANSRVLLDIKRGLDMSLLQLQSSRMMIVDCTPIHQQPMVRERPKVVCRKHRLQAKGTTFRLFGVGSKFKKQSWRSNADVGCYRNRYAPSRASAVRTETARPCGLALGRPPGFAMDSRAPEPPGEAHAIRSPQIALHSYAYVFTRSGIFPKRVHLLALRDMSPAV